MYWQELAEIDETDAATAVLVKTLPVRTLCVLDLNFQEKTLEYRSIAAKRPGSVPLPKSHQIDDNSLGGWLSFASKGENSFKTTVSELPPFMQTAFPEDWTGEVSLHFLADSGEMSTVLLCELAVSRAEKEKWSQKNQQFFDDAVAALAAVVKREDKFRRLYQAKEAAEAEKMAALARLGRREVVDTVVGSETGLKNVVERVQQVAPSELPVIIFGEAGSGKELIARAIHQQSNRATRPFHRVNCGAISPDTIESYLFGRDCDLSAKTENSSESKDSQKGWFEKADGGSLFLDEIGELSHPAQIRLLRFLEEGQFKRIGSERMHTAHVRIITATSLDLVQLLSESGFSEELWYRLAVFPIRIPPLRERMLDIRGLAEHFAKRAATRFGLPLILPNEAGLKLLEEYPWPGNVRELGAVIDRAAILGNGKTLEIALSLGLRKGKSGEYSAPEGNAALNTVIREHILAVLKQTKGRIEGPHGAALILEINPNTLRAKMRKLGIDARSGIGERE